jgi:hypothetical protein
MGSTVTGVGIPTPAAHTSRPLLERLLALAPWLLPRGAAVIAGRPPSSRLRRLVLREVFARGFAALNRHDHRLVGLGYEPDVEIYPAGEWRALGLADCYHGVDGWLELLAAINEYLPDVRYVPDRLIDLGNRWLLRLDMSAGGKSSGAQTHQTVGFVYEVSPRGRIARQDAYWTWEDALAAAGLREGSR